MNGAADQQCTAIIRARSKSFSLASRLLPPPTRRDSVILYAWCRQADDAVDEVPSGVDPGPYGLSQLAEQRSRLNAVYRRGDTDDALLLALREVVERHGIPRAYPEGLLDGMEMDVRGEHYETLDDLMLYCHRAAGIVGLMMAHVLGVDRAHALRNAAHLGMAMQLTNICRDVLEDLDRGRVYLPHAMLREAGGSELLEFAQDVGRPRAFCPELRAGVSRVVERLLDEADGLYRSGAAGAVHLSFRSAFAVHTAFRVYAAIGDRLRARACDPLDGRVFVSTPGKLGLSVRALGSTIASQRLRSHRRTILSSTPIGFPHDILPI